jgi:hypothetical protein
VDAPSLPADRTFVVQFRAASGSASDVAPEGRVEHLVTGTAARFETWSELEEFIVQVLANGGGGVPI